ncbi:hypothetical protein POM88_040010 [Heracleum sosnowskyi]|uniref:R13L1/DRL21-like LRR repeat region domain-containing protein n=1 Tax=Heracleum sosnowskyi TaxID=360622 RepID=A0AAD8HC89_9APIA|nr:hypothetical protein POM88_040010 [Heracleum sosnowskyi]
MKYLKHLDISGFDSRLPTYITEFYNLQTLRVRNLRLKNLRGKLKLYGLNEVTDIEEAGKAKLCEKSYIQLLVLHWSINCDRNTIRIREYNDEDVMKGLEPRPNLKGLKIVEYMGKKFASWITKMTNLVKITLRDCISCEIFPPLGHLPKLREMKIKNMYSAKVIGSNVCGCIDTRAPKTVTTLYPSLTKLTLHNMTKLEEWLEPVMSTEGEDVSTVLSFPELEVLMIKDCPSLRKIPNSCFPSLKKLKIRDLQSSMIVEMMSRKARSLTSLWLENISDGGGRGTFCLSMDSMVNKLLKNNSQSLTFLALGKCKSLACLNLGLSLQELRVYSPDLMRIILVKGSVGLKHVSIGQCLSFPSDRVFAQSQSSTLVTLKLGPFLQKLDEFPWPCPSSMIPFPNLIELSYSAN